MSARLQLKKERINVLLNQNISGNTGESTFLVSVILISGKYNPFLKGRNHIVLAEFSLSSDFHLEVLFLLNLYVKNEKALLLLSYLNGVLYPDTEVSGILGSLELYRNY